MGLSHHIDHVKAARYYIISCEIGNGRACYMMGKLYSESRIIPEDIDQSEAYYRKSNKILTKECNAGNPESCLYAGALYLYSRGVPHDTSKAVSFFEKSCKMDYASGCYTIGYLLNTGRYGIMNIPTLIIFKNGEIVSKFVGLQNKNELKKALDAAL